MDRLIAADTVPFGSHDVAPITGTPGMATDGNPVSGVPATDWPAYGWNMLSEEMRNVILAAGLTPNSSDWTQLSTAVGALTTGRLLNVQVFASSRTYTPTAGTKAIIVELVGGGGAGGGAVATGPGQVAAGSGGGAAGYARKRIVGGVSPQAVTVGAAGTPVVGGAGGNGGVSSFGSILSATGGNGGTLGSAASSSTNAPVGQAGGGGGVGGDLNSAGGTGKAAWYSANPTSGEGGASVFGSGAAFNSGFGSGFAAASPGAGGSGGVLPASSGTNAGGGSGGTGLVIVWEYS